MKVIDIELKKDIKKAKHRVENTIYNSEEEYNKQLKIQKYTTIVQ